jgi:hypothetical protein
MPVRTLALLLCVFALTSPAVTAQSRKKHGKAPLPALLMKAKTAAVVCDACPRALQKVQVSAEEKLFLWNHFRVLPDRRKADVIFLFSGNPYLGDYVSRDGPDKRPVKIDRVVLAVVDPRTGDQLWGDYKEWGSLRVPSAAKALVKELWTQVELQNQQSEQQQEQQSRQSESDAGADK